LNTRKKIDRKDPSIRVAVPALRRVILGDQAIDIQKMLNVLPAMVGYWDRDLRNRLANHAYVDFFGKSPEEMQGIHISEVLGPELYEKNLPFMEGALRGKAQLFDREIKTPGGEVRYTQASYIPDVAEDGEVRGFFERAQFDREALMKAALWD